jgi:hypothetical protein
MDFVQNCGLGSFSDGLHLDSTWTCGVQVDSIWNLWGRVNYTFFPSLGTFTLSQHHSRCIPIRSRFRSRCRPGKDHDEYILFVETNPRKCSRSSIPVRCNMSLSVHDVHGPPRSRHQNLDTSIRRKDTFRIGWAGHEQSRSCVVNKGLQGHLGA